MINKSIVVLSVCSVAMLGSVRAQGLPDTGQTKCYNNTVEIPCPQPGEAFYGQDAQYAPCNPRSYNDLGNGIMRDNVTGLEWLQDGNLIANRNPAFDNDNRYSAPGDGMVSWQHALDYIALINAEQYLGHDDWRLPTIEELSTLNDAGRYDPTIDPAFSTEASWGYWSSTTDAGSTGPAWVVDFGGGGVYVCPKTYDSYVRAVRGNPLPANNFIKNAKGTITDTATGLMWQQATAPGTYTWQQALAYCENLDLAGYSDWRLPDRTELQSIVDYSRSGVAIDPVFSAVSYLYGSSTTDAGSTGFVWYVDFTYGGMGYGGNKMGNMHVRAVRGGTCIPPNRIDNCTVKAGKIDGADSIKFSGLLDAIAADVTSAMGGNVVVTIEADDIEIIYDFLVTATSFAKGKYKSPKVKPANKTDPVTSLQIDTIKGTMKFSAKQVDLTDLNCPITIKIQIGDYDAEIEIGEDIVNGFKKPCPPELMR